jgi:hypothetical protein
MARSLVLGLLVSREQNVGPRTKLLVNFSVRDIAWQEILSGFRAFVAEQRKLFEIEFPSKSNCYDIMDKFEV